VVIKNPRLSSQLSSKIVRSFNNISFSSFLVPGYYEGLMIPPSNNSQSRIEVGNEIGQGEGQ